LLCWSVCKLDRIPRYGRYYRIDIKTRKFSKAQWKYYRRGRWGMNILDRLGLFWPYLDYLNPEWDKCESP